MRNRMDDFTKAVLQVKAEKLRKISYMLMRYYTIISFYEGS
jgi:hypothetical protein